MKANSVKEIKQLIDKVMLPDYKYKTNFSCADFLIDINYNLVIAAKLIEKDNKMVYDFILDTQFVSDKEITYDELKMVINIIDILEANRKFVLSKLKQYTVEEYKKEQIERERRSEAMLEALKYAFERKYHESSEE